MEMMIGSPVWDLGFDFGVKSLEEPFFINEYINDNIPDKYDIKLK